MIYIVCEANNIDDLENGGGAGMSEEKKRLIEEINRNFEDDWQYAQVIYPEENAKKEAFCGEGHKKEQSRDGHQ